MILFQHPGLLDFKNYISFFPKSKVRFIIPPQHIPAAHARNLNAAWDQRGFHGQHMASLADKRDDIPERIYANQKTGAIYRPIVDLIPGRCLWNQSKYSDTNKHTSTAEYYCHWQWESLPDSKYCYDIYWRSQ
jgi:hypothetical protein